VKTLAQLMDEVVTEVGDIMETVMREQMGMTDEAFKKRRAATRAEVRQQMQGDGEEYAQSLKQAGLTDEQVAGLIASATRLRGG
jgi:hypothetical protein